MSLPIITKFTNFQALKDVLSENPGVVIVKFGATWCKPCAMIEDVVEEFFKRMPDNVQIAKIDIDESIGLYGFLKTKKVVNGVPCLLAYYQGNEHHIPDEFVSGTDKLQLREFFLTCYDEANSL
jgi:thiol-disulfide isomerase/thioredoxin